MLNIKILGTGCARCQVLTSLIQEVVTENEIEATIEKVEDIMVIMSYNIMATPAMIINDDIVSKGKILSKNEILDFIKQHIQVSPEIKH